MKLSPLAHDLYDEIAELEIIDAHEHLPTETEYLSFGYSGLNLFANYLQGDLRSAGLDAEFIAKMRDDVTTPVDVWWPKVKPAWEAVQHTSYARALRVTARDYFGIDVINDDTIGELAEKVQADNTPGLYRRVLQEKCNLRLSITCLDDSNVPTDPHFRGITRLPNFRQTGRALIDQIASQSSREVRTLDDAVEAMQLRLRADVAAGAVGFKMVAQDLGMPDPSAAEAAFAEALGSPDDARPRPALRDYLFDKALDVAAETRVPVAVHTGYWGDFRTIDVKFMLGFAMRRSDVHFDMFHLGMPEYREAMLIAKTLPNVSLNLCWCAIISQVQLKRSLDELIDLVPSNKVIAFGGDYRVAVQKTHCHLVLAREVVASVLAKRITAGDFDRAEAMRLARLWFTDNPTRIYRLDASSRRSG